MASKKKEAGKKRAKAIQAADADSRPCLVPDQHVNVCTCYGVEIKVRDAGPDSDT